MAVASLNSFSEEHLDKVIEVSFMKKIHGHSCSENSDFSFQSSSALGLALFRKGNVELPSNLITILMQDLPACLEIMKRYLKKWMVPAGYKFSEFQ
ncbi:uncharacterized protein LOC132037947 isoform X10 [Lycium ferocissimum]|uniref:uncharacterized protein LOC132037947 isoform X10 n=1 Tax=Lycium ferocissimum TaxID=112874 RepID=UPI002815F7BA|nr:uncharacterized protein LOC132037947 isoform X10 [Lycium ferocissimum]